MNELDIKMRLAQADGGTKDKYTVLSKGRDPYRLGTKGHQRNADWLAEAIDRVGITNPIHLRGLHYRLLGSVKLPDGTPYTNTDKTWDFLSEKAAFAARFLETVDFNLIRDNRNEAPKIWTPEFIKPQGWITADTSIQIPEARTLMPRVVWGGSATRQAWRMVIVGEKSGLYDLVAPIAQTYGATLALPNGEISTTMTEEIIAAASEDERPVAVIYLADCDPAGHQMCVSFARKAQAIIDLKYPEVRMRVHPVALTPDQSREWELPSTPLRLGVEPRDNRAAGLSPLREFWLGLPAPDNPNNIPEVISLDPSSGADDPFAICFMWREGEAIAFRVKQHLTQHGYDRAGDALRATYDAAIAVNELRIHETSTDMTDAVIAEVYEASTDGAVVGGDAYGLTGFKQQLEERIWTEYVTVAQGWKLLKSLELMDALALDRRLRPVRTPLLSANVDNMVLENGPKGRVFAKRDAGMSGQGQAKFDGLMSSLSAIDLLFEHAGQNIDISLMIC